MVSLIDFPIEIQIKKNDKILGKNLNWQNTKISYYMYKLLFYLHNENIYSSKWISCIQKTLQDVGLNYKWISNTVDKYKLALHRS